MEQLESLKADMFEIRVMTDAITGPEAVDKYMDLAEVATQNLLADPISSVNYFRSFSTRFFNSIIIGKSNRLRYGGTTSNPIAISLIKTFSDHYQLGLHTSNGSPGMVLYTSHADAVFQVISRFPATD